MVDDLAGVSESGVNSVKLNAFINVKTAEKKLQFGYDKCHTLNITHKSKTIVETDLYIDHWSETHSKNGHLIDEFKGKIKMKNVHEQKYLGFVLSENGSNLNNIKSKQNRAFGIKKDIEYRIKGLGKYTLEGAMIYINSLLRSSVLFAAETMYDIKEAEYRLIERIEEDMLRRIFKTGPGCPIFQLYFESGHIPARFAIKRMKIMFFRYILSQEESSLIYRFLMAQKNDYKRGDWYSEVRNILREFKIDMSDETIKKNLWGHIQEVSEKTNYFCCPKIFEIEAK